MHVSICMTTWNDVRYLPEVFASIHSQTWKDVTVRIFDNGSADGETVPYILNNEPHWLAVRSTKYLGSAVAKNQLIRLALERWEGDKACHAILLAESNTVWHSKVVETLISVLRASPEIDAVQAKVLRAFSERGDIDADAVQSDILESTGRLVLHGYSVADRGAGEMDRDQFDQSSEEVLLTGNIALVRAEALEDVLVKGKAFDEMFDDETMDVDFALRFARLGHATQFVPEARAFRYRGFATELHGKRSVASWIRMKIPSRASAISKIRNAFRLRLNQWLLRRSFREKTVLSMRSLRRIFRAKS